MWCYIYRSTKKENSYLYVDKENDFTSVPKVLLDAFGKPHFVMKLLLTKDRKLALGTAQEVKNKIEQDGFYLQMLTEDDFKVQTASQNSSMRSK